MNADIIEALNYPAISASRATASKYYYGGGRRWRSFEVGKRWKTELSNPDSAIVKLCTAASRPKLTSTLFKIRALRSGYADAFVTAPLA